TCCARSCLYPSWPKRSPPSGSCSACRARVCGACWTPRRWRARCEPASRSSASAPTSPAASSPPPRWSRPRRGAGTPSSSTTAGVCGGGGGGGGGPGRGGGIPNTGPRRPRELGRAPGAFPGVSPAVRVTQPRAAGGWYFDGGPRLNTPIKPALALGAERIVVIALNSLRSSGPRGRPEALDGAAQLAQAVLVDPLVNDVR